MADDTDCPVCGGANPVNWIIQHFNPTVTIRSCEQDFEAALVALLAARLEVEPGWLTATIDTALEETERGPDKAGDEGQAEAEAEALQERYADGGDVRELRDLTPEKFARKYGTDDDDTVPADE